MLETNEKQQAICCSNDSKEEREETYGGNWIKISCTITKINLPGVHFGGSVAESSYGFALFLTTLENLYVCNNIQLNIGHGCDIIN